jgi:hypothetical protein
MRAGVVLRAVLGSLNLGPVQRVYAHGFSRGNVSGVGLLLDRAEAPFDGTSSAAAATATCRACA